MKILFINPTQTDSLFDISDPDKIFFRFFSNIVFLRKPMTFPILASLTPERHTIDVVDGGFHDITFDNPYDLVGISCITAYAPQAYAIADEFRRRGVPVVLGGYHPSAEPDEAKQHADAVVIGEAEETWPQLLNDFEKGQLHPFYTPIRPVTSDLIPSPKKVFAKGIGIQATRGCPNRCEFCSISNMKFRNFYRARPVDVVAKEICMYTDKVFVFQDDSLTVNPTYTKTLFKEIKDLNKKFLAYGNINVLGRDKELLQLASDAGCIGWLVGFESVCQQSLDSIGKRTNTVTQYCSSTKTLHDYGMIVEGSFVFGFDYDAPDIFKLTDEFVRTSEIDIPFALPLIPYPGTPIFERFMKNGRILTTDWSKYSGEYVVFQPKNMTPEELLFSTSELNRTWRSSPYVIRRILNGLSFGFYSFIEITGVEIGLKLLNLTRIFKTHH